MAKYRSSEEWFTPRAENDRRRMICALYGWKYYRGTQSSAARILYPVNGWNREALELREDDGRQWLMYSYQPARNRPRSFDDAVRWLLRIEENGDG